MMHLDDDPPTGGGGGGDDPVLEETPGGGGGGTTQDGLGVYIAMRNEMQQMVFGDGTGFSLAYSMPVYPSQPGTVVVSNDYQLMTVEILTISPMPIDAHATPVIDSAAAQGITNVQSASFTGEAIGNNGTRYPIEGVLATWTTSDGNQINRLVPIAKDAIGQTDENIRRYVVSSPYGVRTNNLDNGRFYNPGNVASCLALTDETERCICFAQLSFDVCAWQAQQTKLSCQRPAVWALVGGLIACAATALQFWALLACILVVAAALALLQQCDTDYRNNMHACYLQFELSLASSCGIAVIEQ